jgi:drug/metabolite transporter (DMT)-like permease
VDYKGRPLGKASAVAGLLTGALVWGLIWYPFRVLEGAGVSGTLATLAAYAVALVAACALFRRDLHALRRPDWMLVLIGLSAGWTNLGYVLGMVHGQVMQVLLLFYLAPLWTVAFAALLLGERPGGVGFLVILLSLAGAALMLWQPGISLPLPVSAAEWFGLSAGIGFALSNVLIRKARHLEIPLKAVAVFAGVVVTAAVAAAVEGASTRAPLAAGSGALLLLVLLGLVILATNLAVQHGLMLVSANRAIVLLLSQLVVAALSSYVLAQEAMNWNQWAGGTMIVAAMLLSGRLGAERP